MVELASAKVIEAIEAQSMTVYCWRINRSPSNTSTTPPPSGKTFPSARKSFENRRKSLLKMRLPEGTA